MEAMELMLKISAMLLFVSHLQEEAAAEAARMQGIEGVMGLSEVRLSAARGAGAQAGGPQRAGSWQHARAHQLEAWQPTQRPAQASRKPQAASR